MQPRRGQPLFAPVQSLTLPAAFRPRNDGLQTGRRRGPASFRTDTVSVMYLRMVPRANPSSFASCRCERPSTSPGGKTPERASHAAEDRVSLMVLIAYALAIVDRSQFVSAMCPP